MNSPMVRDQNYVLRIMGVHADPVYSKVQESLMKKHEEEKEGKC